MIDDDSKPDLSLVATADLIEEITSRHDSCIFGGFIKAGADGQEACVVDFYGSHYACLGMLSELNLDILMHLKANQRQRGE
jgi:hypothetical protein